MILVSLNIIHEKMKRLEFPNRITVELTNRCNVSCTFCPRQSVDMEFGDMSDELYKKIIDEISNHLPVKLVFFFRGESILHPHFFEYAKYAKRKGVGPIQFASNGKALDAEMADKILEAGIDFISFSLDTLNNDLYAKSRQTGDLNLSMRNVVSLCEKCKQRKAEGKFTPTIQVSTIELEEYVPGQKEFIDFWKEYADIVRVYYEHDDKGHFVNEYIKKQFENTLERKPCRKVFTDFLIYWNGFTALCNYDWNGYIKQLNVADMSIEEIWKSDAYENIRKMHNENRFCETIMCADCDHWRIDYTEKGYLGKLYSK